MIKQFEPGETIIREGEVSSCAFFIDGGSAEVIKEDARGGSVRLAVLGEGEIFGEMGLIDEMPRSATVRALEKGCLVTLLTSENYQVLLGENNEALMQIIRVYGERLRSTLKLVAELQSHEKAAHA